MQIGEVIRKYRKNKHLTQEEMASWLGVSTPAVNKWEKGVTQPDIMLLAPIARLLGITLETLLSFHDELTEEEINEIIRDIDGKLDEENYASVFTYAKNILQQYPNCQQLLWQVAVVLDARCMVDDIPNSEIYEEQILEWYERALESGDEKTKRNAADSLFAYYIRKEMYDKAETCLNYFSEEGTERKRKQAVIYSKTNRINEAYKTYEEILFSNYQMLSMVLHALDMMSIGDGDFTKAHYYIEKESSLSRVFEMGTYYEVSCKLELASLEKNVEETLWVVKAMLDSLEQIYGFVNSPLYSHMEFKEVKESFVSGLRDNLLECFRDEEAFGYMVGNAEWENLIRNTASNE